MRFNKLKLHLIPGILCACLWGCNMDDLPDTENIYLPNYNGNIALILGRDTVKIREFLDELGEDTQVQEGQNMNLSFVFKDSTEFKLGSDFIEISSFSNSKYIESPINFPFTPPQDTTINIVRSVAFNFPATDGEQLDSTYYTSGSFELLLNTSFPADVHYEVVTPSFKDITTDQELTITSVTNYQGNVPVLDENDVSLNGYKTLLTSESDSNKFYLNIDASITIPAGTFLSGNEYLHFELNIIDPEFDAIFGDFGQDTFDVDEQRISLDVFSDFSDSGIKFEAPTITFDFKNSFGVPVGLDFSNVYAAFEEKDNLYLTGSITEVPQGVDAPDIEDFGASASSSVVLGSDNSNLADLLSSTPDELVLNLQGYTNTNGETENFLLSSSQIMINSTVQLPLSVQMNEFEYESEMELEGMDELDGTERLSLVINTINDLPFEGEIDLFFVNEEGDEFDSLTNNVLFKSPTSFDGEGKVTEPSKNTTTIELDADKIESLTSATELRLVTRLFTYGYEQDEYVNIFSDYTMIVTLSVEGKVSVDLNSND